MKPNLTKEQTNVLNRACKNILKRPAQYAQGIPFKPLCGSVGCIHGFIAVEAKLNSPLLEEVLDFLSITRTVQDGKYGPFWGVDCWPLEFRELFFMAETNLERAHIPNPPPPTNDDSTVGDVVAAYADGTCVLDDGLNINSPLRALRYVSGNDPRRQLFPQFTPTIPEIADEKLRAIVDELNDGATKGNHPRMLQVMKKHFSAGQAKGGK